MENAQIDDLINLAALAMADGELTAKEREVLQRKASAMGIDADEFEIALAGMLVERRLQLQATPGAAAVLASLPTPPVAAPPVPAPVRPASGSHEAIGKCPACKETISGLSHVCPSCGMVIDADHDAHGSLEEMLEEQEDLLLAAKSLARQHTSQDLGLPYLIPPFVLVYLGVVADFCNQAKLGTCLWLGALGLYFVLRKRFRVVPPVPSRPLPELLDAFEKNERQINLFFGEDRKVSQVLHTLRQQLDAATQTLRGPRSRARLRLRLALLLPVVLLWLVGAAVAAVEYLHKR